MQREQSSIQLIQEYARKNQIFCEYRFEKETGPIHARMYTVRLYLADKSYKATERTIKQAQRTAAQLALNDCRNFLLINNFDQDLSLNNGYQCPLTILSSWATRNHTSIQYVLLNEQTVSPSSSSSYRSRSLFSYRLYLGHDFYFDGHASTDQQARINCALNALFFIRQNHSSFSTPPSSPLSHQTKSTISLMYERAKQLALPVRLESIDPYTIIYFIGDKYSATGYGLNKHAAKQSAAEKLLRILPQTNPLTRIYQIAQDRQVKIEFIPILTSDNYHYRIQFGDNDQAEGFGRTKQLAKQAAAENLLVKFESIVILPPPPIKGLLKRQGSKQEKKHVHFLDDIIEKDQRSSLRIKSTTNNKQKLIELCQKLQIHFEYFDQLNENENLTSSRYQSTVSLSTNDHSLAQFHGYGPSMIRAQENASSAAWNYLKRFFNTSIVD